MSQTQDTQDNNAPTVDSDRVARPDYKKDAGMFTVVHCGPTLLGSQFLVLFLTLDATSS